MSTFPTTENMNKRAGIGKSCRRCRNHGLLISWKGHKYNCPFLRCICEACINVAESKKSMLANLLRQRRLAVSAVDSYNSKQAKRPAPGRYEEPVQRPYSNVRHVESPLAIMLRLHCGNQRGLRVCLQPSYTATPVSSMKCSCLQRNLHLVAQRHLINEMLATRQKELELQYQQLGKPCASVWSVIKDQGTLNSVASTNSIA